MKTVTELITDICADAFVQCGFDAELGLVTKSDRPELCQFQCNGALKGAKLYKKAPFMIADAVVEILNKRDEFQSVEMFIGIIMSFDSDIKIISPDWLREKMLSAAEKIIKNNKNI